MRKKLLALVCLGTLFVLVRADTTTNRLGLTLPTIGSPTWGQKINNNFSILDATSTVVSGNLVVTTGTTSGYSGPLLSTYTARIVFDQTQFSGTLLPSATIYVTISSLPSVNITTTTISNALISSMTATVPAGSGLTVNGALSIGSTSTSTIAGVVTNNSTATATGAQTFSNLLVTSGTANNLTVPQGSTLTIGGSITATNGSTATFANIAGSTITGVTTFTGASTTTFNYGSSTTFKGALYIGATSSMTAVSGSSVAINGSLNLSGATLQANVPMNSHKLTGLSAGSAAGDSVRFEQLKWIKSVSSSTAVSSSTTNSNYVLTAISTSIAPSSASNIVRVCFTGTEDIVNGATTGGIRLDRSGTAIPSSTAILTAGRMGAAAGGTWIFPVAFCYDDSPATTSEIKYTIAFKSSDGATQVNLPGSTAGSFGTIILTEIAP